jgi:hypothetical protein
MSAKDYIIRKGETDAQAMARINAKTGRHLTTLTSYRAKPKSERGETLEEYELRRQEEARIKAEREAAFAQVQAQADAKLEANRQAEWQRVVNRNEGVQNPKLSRVSRVGEVKPQATQLTSEQQQKYLTPKAAEVKFVNKTNAPNKQFLSTIGGEIRAASPRQKLSARIKAEYKEQEYFFWNTLGVADLKGLKNPNPSRNVESVQIPFGSGVKAGGNVLKSSYRGLTKITNIIKPSSLFERSIPTVSKIKTVTPAATKLKGGYVSGATKIVDWSKNTFLGKTTKTAANIFVATETSRAGADVYTTATMPKEQRLIKTAYKKQLKQAESEAYGEIFKAPLFSKEGAKNAIYNIQPLLFEKTGIIKKNPAYKEQVKSSLIRQGVKGSEADILSNIGSRKRNVRQVAELGTNIFIESESELFGRTKNAAGWLKGKGKDVLTQRQGESLGKFQLRTGFGAFKRQAKNVAVASTLEGGGQYYAQQRMADQKITGKGLFGNMLFGAVTGTAAQAFIQIPAINPVTKATISKPTRAAVEIVEGGNEFMGDTLASIRQRTKSKVTGRPVFEPTITMKYSRTGKPAQAIFGVEKTSGLFGRSRGGVLNPVKVRTVNFLDNQKNTLFGLGGKKRGRVVSLNIGQASKSRTSTGRYKGSKGQGFFFGAPTSSNTDTTSNSKDDTKVDDTGGKDNSKNNNIFNFFGGKSNTKTNVNVNANANVVDYSLTTSKTGSAVTAGGLGVPIISFGGFGGRGRSKGKMDTFAKELQKGMRIFRGGL